MTLVIVGLLAIIAAAGTALLVERHPDADPADPVPEPERVRDEGRRHPGLQRFLRARLDPATATGLGLTLALAAIGAAALVLGALLASVDKGTGFAQWDESAAEWGATHTSDVTGTVLRAITELGSSKLVIPLAVVVAVIERRRLGSRALAPFLACAIGGTIAIYNVLKMVVDRERPEIGQLADFAGSSFPSGHTATTAVAYAAFALVLGRRRSVAVRAALAGAAAAITVAVAASRVLLGVHWVTDVLGGVAVGWSVFAATALAFGGRLLHFGAPAEQLSEATTPSPERRTTSATDLTSAGNRSTQ
jgi:membrane-associated phospholipid phosphatase